MSVRLNKLLAERGVGARRKCDAIIAEGRVRVNGQVVDEPGTRVDPQRDRVTVDGKMLPRASAHRYFVLNKPVGVITTLDDPHGRRTVRELMPGGARLFPVGRLDADTSGLLMLTNDGELAHKLMHPRYGVEKVYRVRLSREPGAGQLARLARGVEFEPGITSAPARVRRVATEFDAVMVEIAVHEGRYRQVRRMFEAVGLEVTGLHRSAYGPVRLGPLARGMVRELSDEEVARLRAACARPRPRPSGLARPLRRGRPGGGEGPRRDAGERRDREPVRPVRGVRPDRESSRRGSPPRDRRAPPAPPRALGPREDPRRRKETRGPLEPRPARAERPRREAPSWPARPGNRRGDADWAPPARRGGRPSAPGGGRERPRAGGERPTLGGFPGRADRRGAPTGRRGRAPGGGTPRRGRR